MGFWRGFWRGERGSFFGVFSSFFGQEGENQDCRRIASLRSHCGLIHYTVAHEHKNAPGQGPGALKWDL
jgi:hypothetical protein